MAAARGRATWGTTPPSHPLGNVPGVPGCACRDWCLPAGRGEPCDRLPVAGRQGSCFERVELAVGGDEVVAAALAVLDEPLITDGITDFLSVPTAGGDRCCGSLGTTLAQELLADPLRFGDDVRLWRTSHTGGHRFAPTALVLPQGTSWAFCDKAALTRILRRSGPMDDLLPRYRGCGGLASPAVQALERAVLYELGWPLFDMTRRGVELGEGRTELVVEGPSGERVGLEGRRACRPGGAVTELRCRDGAGDQDRTTACRGAPASGLGTGAGGSSVGSPGERVRAAALGSLLCRRPDPVRN